MLRLLLFILLLMFPVCYCWGSDADVSRRLASAGAALFRELGCSGCHMGPSTVRAPLLEGLYGKPVLLKDGTIVIADERYIRESILLPNSQIVAGYAPEMPSFTGEITEDELIRLVAYIKSLADEPPAQR